MCDPVVFHVPEKRSPGEFEAVPSKIKVDVLLKDALLSVKNNGISTSPHIVRTK